MILSRREFIPLLLAPIGALSAGCQSSVAVPSEKGSSGSGGPPLAAPTLSSPQTPKPERWGMTAAQADEWRRIEDAAVREGELVYYGQGLLPQAQAPELARAFNEDYPDIKVNLVNVGGGPQVVARVTAEQDSRNYQADVFDTSARNALQMYDPSGYTQPFDAPAASDPSVQWRTSPLANPGKSGATIFRSQYQCLFANTNLVSPTDEPRTYADFTNPRFRGSILWNTPWTTGSGWEVYYYAKQAYGQDWVSRMLTQDVTFSSNNASALTQIARGEKMVALGVNSSVGATQLTKAGEPIKAIWPTDYTISATGVIVLANRAPHVNAAKVFINWYLLEAGQRFWGSVGNWPIRADVQPSEAWMMGAPGSSIIHDSTTLPDEILKATLEETAAVFKR